MVIILGRRIDAPDRKVVLCRRTMSGLCGTGILLTLISFCDGLGLVQERLAMRGLSYGLAGAMSAASSYPFRHAWLSQQANKADQSIKVLSEALVSAASVDGQCVSTLPSTGTIVSSISTISPDVAAVRAAVSATTTTLVSLQALAKVVTMVGAVRGHPKLVAQGLRRIKSSRWKEHNSGNDVQGELSLRQGKFDRLGNELSISDAEIRTLQAVVAGTATTMLTFGSFTTDVVATALTKSVTLSSYDKIFHNMGLAMGKAGIPSLFGFPAVLVAAAGTGVVASLISLNAPCKRKALNLSPKQRQDMASKQAVLKEVMSYVAFFGIYHALFLAIPTLGYSTFGQGVGGATAAVLASYIPTQHTQWRVPRGNAGFHQDLASAAPPPNPIVSVAQAMEKAETFVRTAVFCGVSYGLGMHFIL